MNVPLFSLEKISFAYPERPALFRELDLSLHEGEQIGLHGPNGSGKTTLLRLILGLVAPQHGTIRHRGKPVGDEAALHAMRCRVGLVMQNSDDQLFSVTVLDDVAFGPLNLGMTRRAAKDRAMETLTELGLEKLADRAPHRLSIGEKKMAAIAAILSMQPEALLLDEPTASLDDDAKARLNEVLRRQTIARIIVSHDKDFLGQTSPSLLRITGAGKLEWSTPPA